MVIYLLSPINFVSAAGYVTWRNIDTSNSAPGFTPTTLSAAITSTSATTMSVNSSAGYPSPPFVVDIGASHEAVEVTAISGTTWTIVRGYGGTTAATDLISANVSGPTTYSVSFVPATPATSIQAIVIDFCTDSPIYNSSTCFTPAGMLTGSVASSSGSITSFSGVTGISSSLFNTTYTDANTNQREDFIAADNGTGFVPLTPTTLSAAITTTGATSISVTSSASYPAASTNLPSSWFYVTIPSTGETMQVTNVSGTTWTVVRGALGTTAATALISSALSQPPIAFSIYGIMNPTSVGPYYARIYTFSTYSTAQSFFTASSTSGVLSYTYATAASANIDAGGVALEVTNSLTITAKVQEFLQFCIYSNATATAAPCTLTGSTVTLGNSSGILSISTAYVDSSTRFDVATNASGYVAISFTGTPLANGSLLIENSSASGTGSTAATAYVSTVGTNQFGVCAVAATSGNQATNYTSANLSFPNNTYNSNTGGACPSSLATSATYGGTAIFGLNIAQAGSIYGDLLALQKPGVGSTGLISFLGNISPATLAGVYSTTFNFVASGTY